MRGKCRDVMKERRGIVEARQARGTRVWGEAIRG